MGLYCARCGNKVYDGVAPTTCDRKAAYIRYITGLRATLERSRAAGIPPLCGGRSDWYLFTHCHCDHCQLNAEAEGLYDEPGSEPNGSDSCVDGFCRSCWGMMFLPETVPVYPETILFDAFGKPVGPLYFKEADGSIKPATLFLSRPAHPSCEKCGNDYHYAAVKETS